MTGQISIPDNMSEGIGTGIKTNFGGGYPQSNNKNYKL